MFTVHMYICIYILIYIYICVYILIYPHNLYMIRGIVNSCHTYDYVTSHTSRTRLRHVTHKTASRHTPAWIMLYTWMRHMYMIKWVIYDNVCAWHEWVIKWVIQWVIQWVIKSVIKWVIKWDIYESLNDDIIISNSFMTYL